MSFIIAVQYCIIICVKACQSDEELHGFIHLVVAHESIEHAAEDDVVGLQASLALHLLRSKLWMFWHCLWHCDLRISQAYFRPLGILGSLRPLRICENSR